MKNFNFFLFYLLCCFSVTGQSYKESQTVQMIEHTIVIPDGGSLKEALSLTKEWTEQVLRKNENFESIQLLISENKEDSISLLVLYKYRLNNTRSTNKINQELINAHWPEEGAFQKFLQKMHWYINPKQNKKSVFKELILE